MVITIVIAISWITKKMVREIDDVDIEIGIVSVCAETRWYIVHCRIKQLLFIPTVRKWW